MLGRARLASWATHHLELGAAVPTLSDTEQSRLRSWGRTMYLLAILCCYAVLLVNNICHVSWFRTAMLALGLVCPVVAPFHPGPSNDRNDQRKPYRRDQPQVFLTIVPLWIRNKLGTAKLIHCQQAARKLDAFGESDVVEWVWRVQWHAPECVDARQEPQQNDAILACCGLGELLAEVAKLVCLVLFSSMSVVAGAASHCRLPSPQTTPCCHAPGPRKQIE
jgi:hypothetical protein